mmetsp:Transcript_7559/g.12708  ORF Transcript_7559/g.12708 Transcript_7559/m.12708 type:complete len:461 (-) Transcript_7559:142-1524(-)|eukprot:CAMPEP_0114434984 /NCGR_PEP_ID=MMETSP0103-20121206/12571_1 /TAXON_ID=37642 ORGANISM="Paraphysomonas imperforata, Strain PA2" /NCGR_SAMPLE_ID=MMETSP0103 /ASSEMBLY_ACC=CAM_ASM_000201 /LENGTH=460 /DNA_ID=CAMNT_0001604945 /DNA_START=65 /DNA_END=1447 /DNA_ORIENTATION=-
MSTFALDSQVEGEKTSATNEPRHGVGDREKYYGKWDEFAKKSEEELAEEEEEAKRKEKERVANIPDSEAHKRDREKREALKEAKKQWDEVQSNEKSKEITFEKDVDVKDRVINAAAMGDKRVLYIKDGMNSSYVLADDIAVTKIFIDDCKDCAFTFHCKIATSFIEIHQCENVQAHVVSQEIHTIQVDLSQNVTVLYNKGLYTPDTKVYHSSVRDMTISYDHKGTGVPADYKSQTVDDYELSRLAEKTRTVANLGKDDQFVTAYVPEVQDLVTDLVLRDASGHPTTTREIEARKRMVEEQVRSKGLDINAPEIQKYLHEYDPLTPVQLGLKYKEEGNKAFKECDYRQASVHYTQAVDTINALPLDEVKDASDTLKAALSNRAACSLKLGDPENALADAMAVLEIDPKHVKANFRRGMALHALERYREACPVLSKALELEPKNAQIKAALTFAERRAMQSR